MAKSKTSVTTPVRGEKTAIVERLARRPQGVTGKEIMVACSWPSGSAAWRVGMIAQRLSLEVHGRSTRTAARLAREISYRLVDPKPATKRAPQPRKAA